MVGPSIRFKAAVETQGAAQFQRRDSPSWAAVITLVEQSLTDAALRAPPKAPERGCPRSWGPGRD